MWYKLILRKRPSLLSVCVFLLTVIAGFAIQPLSAAEDDCVKYGFKSGDSCLFRVELIDTVDIIGQETLVRTQTHMVALVCDHIDDRGLMYIRQTMHSLSSTERYLGGLDTLESVRSEHPWIGRTSFIIMDSSGARTMSRVIDTSKFGVGPGGAFAAQLVPALLDTACHNRSSSRHWMIGRLDTLAENGFPYPMVRHLYSCAVKDSTYNNALVHRVIYAETGQASFVTEREPYVYMRNVIDAHGEMQFTSSNNLPYRMESHQKLRVSIQDPQTERRGTIHSHMSAQRVYSTRE